MNTPHLELYDGHYYKVTDDEISPTGKIETYLAETRQDAIDKALYTHQLHAGRAFKTPLGVIHCPKCGQIAIVKHKRL